MILKIIGGIIIMISTTSIGINISKNFRLRPVILKEIQRDLEFLMTEIVYGQTPLPEAFENTAKIASKQISDLFYKTLTKLKSDGNITISQAFNATLDLIDVIDDEDKKILRHFGNNLGTTDVENQVRAFKLALKQLSKQEDTATRLKEKNEKLFREIGFLVGAAMFILLI